MNCPFCENTAIKEYSLSKKYYHCEANRNNGCGGFFVHKSFFDSTEEQKKRYLQHKNELNIQSEKNGYRKYLEKFVSTVLTYVDDQDKNIHTLFDYGSGPSPSLVMLLEEYNQTSFFSNDVSIKHWDPFFYPDGDFFTNGADIVFCLEVIEHFEKPLEGFNGLAKSCAKDGLIAIQTQLAPNTFEEFKTWWYKEDSTHVSFYSLKAIKECAIRAGLTFEAEKNGVVFLSKK